jgi:hypothetical protein
MTVGKAIVLDMAISHAEFRRTLVQAFGVAAAPDGDDGFRVNLPEGAVHIGLGPETPRRIASLSYPCTLVSIDLDALPCAAAEHFMARFHRYFQRGGG